jgi:UMF1 family MFS transporter
LADHSGPKLDRRAVLSWALFDFANSAFTTVIVTFVYAAYFAEAMMANNIEGTAWWGHAVTVSALVVAISSPFLGAIADRGGYRKRFLLIASVISVLATVALFFPRPYGHVASLGYPSEAMLALGFFIIANVGFELGLVFYNAFLPDIAPPDKIGRVSGFGWGLGYVGGLIALVLSLVLLVQTDNPIFGFSQEGAENIRAVCLLTAVWFAVFAIPLFLFVKEDRSKASPPNKRVLQETYAQLRRTWVDLREYRHVVRLLIARLFYNDGLVTIFSFGGIYAATIFGFTVEEIIVFGIVLNVAAGLGAWGFSILDDKLGGKKTIKYSLIGLMAAVVLAVWAPDRIWFWMAGIAVGIFAGPNQSASRSLLGRFVPDEKENEFFGFFAFSGKATSFMGPLLLAWATALFETQRAGVATILIFMVIGYIILQGVDEKEGIRLAGRGGSE